MSNDDLQIALNRRSMLAGVAMLGALVPSLALAEGGLKGTTADEQDAAPEDDLAGIGVTGDASYESPLFGYGLEWSNDWVVSPWDPGESSEADGWDIFRLEWSDSVSEESTLLEFNGFSFPEANLEPWLDSMIDPESLAEYFGGDERDMEVALVERDGDIMEVAWRMGPTAGNENAIYMVSSYRVLRPDLMLMSALAVLDVDQLSTVASGLIDGVTLDGEPLLAILSVAAIEDAFTNLA